LGVSGGIAAYKSAAIVRGLQERGAEVRCALTRAGREFVTPLTLEVLTGHAVYQEEYLVANGSGRELHIDAAAWADVLLIAPATAHTLSRLSLGLADDFLSTTALAFTGRVLVAPAMHHAMWHHPTVQANVHELQERGVTVLGPEFGRLASGEEGLGRMAEPEAIVAAALVGPEDSAWGDRRVVIAAGPTHEPLDPVRFLSNASSGKMGFALAAEAAARGARVHLVSGPVSLTTPPAVQRIDVTTAAEMAAAVVEASAGADVVIMAAAVADFRPRAARGEKIKKNDGAPELVLEATEDILARLRDAAPDAYRVGFAAETTDLENEARRKLTEKGAAMIVANDVSQPGVGFGSEDNEVTIVRAGTPPLHIERQSKRDVAGHILDAIDAALAESEDAS
jgi:phosphopantothenoylcysteine decarboxylase/phosphopantothenate--cysteine ligase